MKLPKNKGVIVIGGHVQGLGIIRTYGENKIPTILLDSTNYNIARHSKYCSKFYKYNDDNLLGKLQELGKKENYKNWLVVPTTDLQVKILSENKELLSKYFKISTSHWDIIVKCYNKINTYKLAEELNIDIPQSYFPNNEKDLDNIDISFPCIIKPAVMHSFHKQTKKKVFVCHSKQDLIEKFNIAVGIVPRNEIIIQEIIEGDSNNQYSACFLYSEGEIKNCLVARRKRQHPIDFGNATTFAETVKIPELIESAEKILKSINYSGVCEVEFKKDKKDGKYKFLEINPRTWKWHLIAKPANVPFLINLYKLHNNLKLDKTQDWENASWVHLLTDWPIRFKYYIKKIRFEKISKPNKIFAVWNLRDMKPFIFEKLLLIYLILKR